MGISKTTAQSPTGTSTWADSGEIIRVRPRIQKSHSVCISRGILGRGPKGHVQRSHGSVAGNSQELVVLVPDAEEQIQREEQFWDV